MTARGTSGLSGTSSEDSDDAEEEDDDDSSDCGTFYNEMRNTWALESRKFKWLNEFC